MVVESLLLLFSFVAAFENQPNAFIALRVSNPQVIAQVQQIGKDLTAANPQFEPFLRNVSKLHVSLNVLYINETNQPKALAALAELPKNLCNISSSIPILFMGTSALANQTLLGKLNAMSTSVVSSVHHKINETFSAHGVGTIPSNVIFEPHMTIVKLAENRLDLFKTMANMTKDFRLSTGEFVKEILLCKMNPAPNDTFYEILGRTQLVPCSPFREHLLTNRVPLFKPSNP